MKDFNTSLAIVYFFIVNIELNIRQNEAFEVWRGQV